MKIFKGIDLAAQLLLLAGYTTLAWHNGIEYLIEGYLVVGAWHIISMAVHGLYGWCLPKPGARYAYHWISAVAVLTLPLGSFWILAILGAPMAVFYTSLCAWEYAALSPTSRINPPTLFHETV